MNDLGFLTFTYKIISVLASLIQCILRLRGCYQIENKSKSQIDFVNILEECKIIFQKSSEAQNFSKEHARQILS